MFNLLKQLKYDIAANKALLFMKNQMDVSAWRTVPWFAQQYSEDYAENLVWGGVNNLPVNANTSQSQYISADYFYDDKYAGVISGTWSGLGSSYKEYAVEIYNVTDQPYLVCTVPLRSNGTWRSELCIKATEIYRPAPYDLLGNLLHDTGVRRTVTYWYWEPLPVDAGGIKEIRLVKRNWAGIPAADNLPTPIIDGPDIYPAELASVSSVTCHCSGNNSTIYDYAYPRYTDIKARFYSLSDAEYLMTEVDIWNISHLRKASDPAVAVESIFYTTAVTGGKKIVKVVEKDAVNADIYHVIAIAGAKTNKQYGSLPASYFIPPDDPQYDKDGSSALGMYGIC